MEEFKKNILIAFSFLIIFTIVLSVIALTIVNSIDNVKNTLNRCQEKGWDGIKFVSKYSNEVICSNFTQAEKDDFFIKQPFNRNREKGYVADFGSNWVGSVFDSSGYSSDAYGCRGVRFVRKKISKED